MKLRTQGLYRGVSWLQAALLPLVLAVAPGPGAAAAQDQDSTDSSEGLQTQGGKKKYRKRQTRPIKLATSGGNLEDKTFFNCCDGTLGALVEKDGIQYILSNNHVLARSNKGRKGEAIIQPGLSDQDLACVAADPGADTVAHLSGRKKIRFADGKKNWVDAALAEVVPGAVRTDGELVKIGVPGNTPAEAFIGMSVKKAGRKTGLTRGTVIAVNTTILEVEYPDECGSISARTARFVDQIIIAGGSKAFSGPGDSGAMVYEDVSECPSPVGLLFAGNDEITAANPAARVLRQAGKMKPQGTATFVGCTPSAPALQTLSNEVPILRERQVRDATGVMRRWEEELLSSPGIHGVGIGMTLSGPVEPAIYVLANESREEVMKRLPETLDGYRIEVIRTDNLVAY